jgi:hypothetical protein
MNIKLELTIEQVNIVLAGLGKLPYEAVAPVVQAIHQQGASQAQAQQGDANEDNSAQG